MKNRVFLYKLIYKTMKFLLVFLIISSLPVLSQTKDSRIGHDSLNTFLLNELVIDQINYQRIAHSFQKLKKSNDIYKKTNAHTNKLIKLNLFEHSKFGFGEILEKISFSDTITYFNLSKQIIKVWMNSPRHRENMLNSRYDYIGTSCGVLVKNYFSKKYLYPAEVVKSTQYTIIITCSFDFDSY